MSLEVNIGKRGNILEVGPQNASQVSVIILQLLMIATMHICSYRAMPTIINNSDVAYATPIINNSDVCVSIYFK
jgi:hypothetical protein